METKEVKITIPEGYEIDKENSTFEHIKLKKIHKVNIWKDINFIEGSVIHGDSNIHDVSVCIRENTDKNIFSEEKYAKSALALAQISQLMPYYGEEITDEEWKSDICKYSITISSNGNIHKMATIYIKDMISFHTAEQRDRFLSFPENVQLVKDLYMVD